MTRSKHTSPLLCRLLHLRTRDEFTSSGQNHSYLDFDGMGCSGTLGNVSVHTERCIYIYVCGDEREEGRAEGRRVIPHLEETGGGNT